MYKGREGMWSYYFHRLSGVGVLFFLLAPHYRHHAPWLGPGHLRQDGKALRIASLYAERGRSPGGCAYHALNGIRIFIIDITPVTSRINDAFSGLCWFSSSSFLSLPPSS